MATETTGAGSPEGVSVAEIVEGLNDLLQLDRDAIAAYRVAVERLDDPGRVEQAGAFLRDHERHELELSRAIQGLGGTPADEALAAGPFQRALVRLGGLGGDGGTLLAFRAGELRLRRRYAAHVARAARWPAEVRAAIERNSLDEERHYCWTVEALREMRVGRVAGALGATAGLLRGGRLWGGVEERVSARPFRAILVTFAAGYLVGRVLR